MKSYDSIISSFIIENDIRCIPDQRCNVWFELKDVIKALKLNTFDDIQNITVISYMINNEEILFISRKTVGYLITQSNTRYAKEMFTNSSYTFRWFK